jgi:hypothetical protein
VRYLVLAVIVVTVNAGAFWARNRDVSTSTTSTIVEVRAAEATGPVPLNLRLAAQYQRAISLHYISAKHEAERTGNWYRAYHVIKRIYSTCDLDSEWEDDYLKTIPEQPTEEMGIDFKQETLSTAIRTAGCLAEVAGPKVTR